MQETWVQSLEKEMTAHLPGKFLPAKSPGQRSLVGYSTWGCKELDMTQRLNNSRLSMVTV